MSQAAAIFAAAAQNLNPLSAFATADRWRVVMRYRLIGLAVFVLLIFRSGVPLWASEVRLGTTGGLYTVPVQINGSITLQFLVDPGAAVVVIPLPVLKFLIRSGTMSQSDIRGEGTAELADRSLYEALEVILPALRIGDTVVRNIRAAVSPGLNMPLLGQSFLNRFSSVTFDNRRHVLILSGNTPAPNPRAPATVSLAPYPSYPSYPAGGPLIGGEYGAFTYGPGFNR